jgi:hypothetical protein
MPARAKRSADGEVVVVSGFLLGLSSAVSALTRFMLGDAKRSPVPVHPRRLKVRNLTSAKPESTREETNESCFEIVRCWKD